jgi:hypothetical protein
MITNPDERDARGHDEIVMRVHGAGSGFRLLDPAAKTALPNTLSL